MPAQGGHRATFVVLGGGPAGLAAGWKLAQRGWRDVTVLERGPRVGGNAGSFVIDDIPVDYGSHRLHPACSAPVLADIRALLGTDLLDRPRHGRIRLRGRWVHFPLRPFDLVAHLPPSFILGVAGDVVRKPFAGDHAAPSFASILEQGLGRTICRDFYFPYAAKIWGQAPDALDAEQARRRVSSGSLGKMVRRILNAAPGMRKPGTGRFFYPKRGFGQISEAYLGAAVGAGVKVMLDAKVSGVQVRDGRVTHVEIEDGTSRRELPATHVLSTIPLPVLARLVRGDDRPAPVTAAGTLTHRAMVLVYLTLDAAQFTEYDAHYFPEAAIRITRLSEPKNYGLAQRPGRTVLCAELPCNINDPEWSMSNEELGALVCRDLEHAGLGPLPRVNAVETRRLPHAYPLYTKGYRAAFNEIDAWVEGIDGLVTFGRQGLFVHDNTHHTLAMAYALVECLRDDAAFDADAWARARIAFEANVVED
jgi:protoporphyrinogen oxidase